MKKEKAIFTIVFDGGPLFKVWYKYYTQFFPEEDIYVLTREGPPDQFLDKKCNLRDLPFPMFGSYNYEFVHQIQQELFQKYDCVMYADFDEIVCHPDGLDSVIKNLNFDFANCTGYDIVQVRDKQETTIDFNRPIVDQRNFWYPFDAYDKPLILKKPAIWEPGFHGIRKEKGRGVRPPNTIKDLVLLHLRKLDYDLCRTLWHKYKSGTEEYFQNWYAEAVNNTQPISQWVKDKKVI